LIELDGLIAVVDGQHFGSQIDNLSDKFDEISKKLTVLNRKIDKKSENKGQNPNILDEKQSLSSQSLSLSLSTLPPDLIEFAHILHQMAFADRILINKCDLIQLQEKQLNLSNQTSSLSIPDSLSLSPILSKIEKVLRKVNPTSSIYHTIRSKIDLVNILNIRAYHTNQWIDDDSIILSQPNVNEERDDHSNHSSTCPDSCSDHTHSSHSCTSCSDFYSHSKSHSDPSPSPTFSHFHDHSIRSITIDNLSLPLSLRSRKVSLSKLREWMASLLWTGLSIPSSQYDFYEGPDKERTILKNGDYQNIMGSHDDVSVRKNEKDEISIESLPAFQPSRINDILRIKAIFPLSPSEPSLSLCTPSLTPHFLQAVRTTFDITEMKSHHSSLSTSDPSLSNPSLSIDPSLSSTSLSSPFPIWPAVDYYDPHTKKRYKVSNEPFTRFVFIGRNLDEEELRRGFDTIVED
jgi:G3E family GTPase